ncbi:MAG: T9SS type A sorting domain-containing protein [Bacteroidia bacterium]
MKQLALLILLLQTTYATAQNQANNWYFGNNAGITFSTNPPTFLSGGQINTAEGCASISDNNGNLLFYSDGVTVWDSTHAVMQNGTGLLGDFSSTQSGLIIPAPGSATFYYLITAPVHSSTNPLAYSIIDMTLNNGLGAITVKNVILLDTSTEKVTAVYHQNGIDIWIIAHGYPNNSFYAFLLTSLGINPIPVISSAGNLITIASHKTGYLKASPCGNQLSMANYKSSGLSTLELFDLEDSTGVVSNGLQIGQWNVGGGVYGEEFSPDNSKLYASIISPPIVVQYDLLAGSPPAIIASMDTIGVSLSNVIGALQTGPDGRIYLTKFGGDSLACITNPNQLGTSCGFVENYVSLGSGVGRYGLPNFLTSLFCNIPSAINEVNEGDAILIYPNPFGDEATLQISNDLLSRKCELVIYDLLGHRVKQITIVNQHTALHKENLTDGIYFYVLTVKDEVVKKGKFVIE